MKPATLIAKAYAESQDFGRYAENVLHYYPDTNLPTLRDLYKHGATVTEYRRHLERLEGKT